jgi:hypothetical protein
MVFTVPVSWCNVLLTVEVPTRRSQLCICDGAIYFLGSQGIKGIQWAILHFEKFYISYIRPGGYSNIQYELQSSGWLCSASRKK